MPTIRVMFAMGGVMNRAGAETVIMQYLRKMYKNSNFSFSFLVHGFNKGAYDDEIASMGIPIYHVERLSHSLFSYSKSIRKILKEHPCDIIHCNMDTSCGYFLSIAKKCGIETRIAHSHSTNFLSKSPFHLLIAKKSKKLINKVATDCFACSKEAGEWLFSGKQFVVINNAIDTKKYSYNKNARDSIRRALLADDNTLVVCHIGRFTWVKNHEGLIKIFSLVKKQRPNSKLVLVGGGELVGKIKTMVDKYGLKNDVYFLGIRKDIPDILQACDVFAMPSNFEGIPVSGVEAQAAGLPCFFSNSISTEICFTQFAHQLPKDDYESWADCISKVNFERNYEESSFSIRERGFDINVEADKLMKLYVSMFKRNK